MTEIRITKSNMIFENRIDAAKKLAKKLAGIRDPIILAIPRGGVVTGDVVASELGAELDIMVSRKIGAPQNSELAIGAVAHDGSYFPNEDITRMLDIPNEYIKSEIAAQMKEIERRLMKFRGKKDYKLEKRVVILVDDGIATGATMFIAAQWINKQNPKQLIIAIPVAPKETIEKLNKIADKVVVLQTPQFFNSVSEFYRNFEQVEDSEVQKIMIKHGYKTQLSEKR